LNQLREFLRSFTWLDVAVLAGVVLIGLTHLPYPFDGDQALFTIGASKINNGAVLYRDFWDLKQPGIFGFYLLAGKLFGFTEIGVHALELIYMTAFAVVLLITLRSYFESRAIASLVPAFTIGIYYCVARSWHLTQVEGLVAFPLFLSIWFASESSKHGGRARAGLVFLAGIMGGFVLLLKFVFLPILISISIAVIARTVLARSERIPAAIVRFAGPCLVGLVLPLALGFLYFGRVETIGLMKYTFFEYPSRAIAGLPGWRLSSFAKSLFWFLSTFAPLLALAFVWLSANLTKLRELLVQNLVFFNLVLWLLIGFLVIVVQRLSWWDYHYMIFVAPVGILATKGWDILWALLKKARPSLSTRTGRLAVALCMVLLFLPFIASLLNKTMYLASFGFARGSERRLQYQSEISDAYRTALAETEFLAKPQSRPGGIFVAGNPIFYYLSHRDQAIASNGWMLEFYLSDQWSQLIDQLSIARPPYVFVGSEYASLIPVRSPELQRFLNGNYQVLRQSSAGTWFVLQNSAQSDAMSKGTK
jgi:hypothetical protein